MENNKTYRKQKKLKYKKLKRKREKNSKSPKDSLELFHRKANPLERSAYLSKEIAGSSET
jgi:hypothetical protein